MNTTHGETRRTAQGETARRIALVTGANKGLGLETARQLARDHGYSVLLGARDADKGESAARLLRDEGLEAR